MHKCYNLMMSSEFSPVIEPAAAAIAEQQSQLSRLYHFGRQASALALSLAAGVNLPVQAADASPGRQLEQISQLPGYDIGVDPTLVRELKAATVQLLVRPDSLTPQQWQPLCTAVNVAIPGNSTRPESIEAVGAAHCYSALTYKRLGVFRDPSNPSATAENFINRSGPQYAVSPPLSTPGTNFGENTSFVVGVSVDTDMKDVAMSADIPPAPALGDPSGDQTVYHQPAAIPLRELTEGHLVRGQKLTIVSLPGAAHGNLVTETGRYIGQFRLATDSKTSGIAGSETVSIVGLNPASPSKDACNFGASGAFGAAGHNTIAGPANFRINFGYGPGRKYQKEDRRHRVSNLRLVREIEQQTHVDVSHEVTLCALADTANTSDSHTLQDLENGFAVPAPAISS